MIERTETVCSGGKFFVVYCMATAFIGRHGISPRGICHKRLELEAVADRNWYIPWRNACESLAGNFWFTSKMITEVMGVMPITANEITYPHCLFSW